MFRHLLRRSARHQAAAFSTCFGADVQQIVGFGKDIWMVLDDDHRVPLVHKAVQHIQQARHVAHMEADGGLLDEVEIALVGLQSAHPLRHGLALANAELGDEFQALGLAAAEGGAGLA